MTKLTPLQLEEYLREIDEYVARTRLGTYEKISELVITSGGIPIGVGYHRDYGWFVLLRPEFNDPILVWSEKEPRE